MQPHGHLDLKWSGNTLYVEAFGPFNDEGAKAAAEYYIDFLKNKECSTFSVIEILHADSIGTPDTMQEVSRIWNYIGEQGCTAFALVYVNEIQRKLAEEFIPPFGKLFSDLGDAEKWIRDRQ